MKQEESPSIPSAGTPGFSQWNSNVPIDPALQSSGNFQYQSYSSQYSQSSGTQYQAAAASTPSRSGAAGTDNSDLATLNDALGSAGVDLRAEEETLHRSYESQTSYRNFDDRTRKQPPFPNFDTRFLGPTMRNIGTQHKVPNIPEDTVNYLALALRIRLQDLVTAMIAAAKHRTDEQFDRPASHYEDGSAMWSILVRSDVAKQLAAIEKVEREEEFKIRRERKEKQEMIAAHAAALAAQAAGGSGDGDDAEGGGNAKKKRKKDGPGVTARNMPADVQKKMSNAAASHAAGIGSKYSWMTSANASSAATPRTKAAASSSNTPNATPAPASGWSRPYVSKKSATTSQPTQEEDTRMPITLRDAMFVVEKERGHGGGRGAARGWT